MVTASTSLFQSNYFKALGASTGLPASAFTVNAVTAASLRRGLLAGGGAVIDYNAQAPNTDPAALQSAIANPATATAVGNQMTAAGFKGTSVGTAAVTNQTPTSAPTAPPVLVSTLGSSNSANAAASPGAIAGYVIAGVVVIVGMVLLIIFMEMRTVTAQQKRMDDPSVKGFYPAAVPPPSPSYAGGLQLQELGASRGTPGSPGAAAVQGRSGIQYTAQQKRMDDPSVKGFYPAAVPPPSPSYAGGLQLQELGASRGTPGSPGAAAVQGRSGIQYY